MQRRIEETLEEAGRAILGNKLRRFDESSRGHRKLETIAADRARTLLSSGKIAKEEVETVAELEERKLELEQATRDSQELLDLLERRLFFLQGQLEQTRREMGKGGKSLAPGIKSDLKEREVLLQKQIEFVSTKRKSLIEDISQMEKFLQSLDEEERSLES